MVAKDSRPALIILLFLLLLAAGPWSAVKPGERASSSDDIELDEVVASGPIETNRGTRRSLTVLSINLNRFFDDVDDGNREKVLTRKRFRQRVKITADAFAERFALPDVIAVQEVENGNVLRHLAKAIRRDYRVDYRALLIEGQDLSGIDVGYLLRSDLHIRHREALFADLRLTHQDQPLFSRPPLYLELCRLQSCFELLNLHLRSMRGIGNADRGDRVARKRRQQAEAVAAWCQQRQSSALGSSLMVIGDLNALTPADEHVDVAGIIRGAPDNRATRLAGRDLIEPDLIDLTARIPPDRRYSFVYRGRRQQLDYLLVNRDFTARLDTIAFARIDRRVSDHAGLYARFSW